MSALASANVTSPGPDSLVHTAVAAGPVGAGGGGAVGVACGPRGRSGRRGSPYPAHPRKYVLPGRTVTRSAPAIALNGASSVGPKNGGLKRRRHHRRGCGCSNHAEKITAADVGPGRVIVHDFLHAFSNWKPFYCPLEIGRPQYSATRRLYPIKRPAAPTSCSCLRFGTFFRSAHRGKRLCDHRSPAKGPQSVWPVPAIRPESYKFVH